MSSTPDLRAELIDTLPVANTLGEGVLWDEIGKRVWWTDIEGRRLFRYTPNSRLLDEFELPERLGSFGFVAGSDCIIAAFESALVLYHPERGTREWVHQLTHDATRVRLNDGRVDPAGRFWVGSMVEDDGSPQAKLYRLERGQVTVHLAGLGIANSLCFGSGGRSLYFADSPRRTIWRFDADPINGTLSDRRVFATTREGVFPDGSQVDAAGCVWNAQWGGGCVMQYTPDGQECGRLPVPVSQPTCVAFGGEQMNLLFVTTARLGLSEEELAAQPQAGSLFVFRVPSVGLIEPRYDP